MVKKRKGQELSYRFRTIIIDVDDLITSKGRSDLMSS